MKNIDEWFPVGGEAVASDKQGCICLLTDKDGNRVVVDADTPDAEVMRLDANSRMICAAPSLHAYAKAEELRAAWTAAEQADNEDTVWNHMRDFLSHLKTMGWDRSNTFSEFLATYRTSALAKAGGQ
jgi:hypothetical protein